MKQCLECLWARRAHVALAAAVSLTSIPTFAQEPWAAPPLERSVSVRVGATDEVVSFDALIERLAEADVVFIGETHDDETTHRVEAGIYAALLGRHEGRVVLGLEMFERDVQASLDAYLAGRIDEAEFLSESRPWSNYRTAYRPLVELARAAGAPVVASNFPRPLRGIFVKEGAAGLDVEAKRHVPERLLENSPEYWERVDNAVRGHLDMMGGGGQPPEERLTAMQSLWDNSMGEACARALEEHPGFTVVHVNGAFHTAYGDGTAHQLALRAPGAKVLTVDVAPVSNPSTVTLVGRPEADFVVFAEARASDVRDGAYSVQVSRKHDWRLHAPPSVAAGEVPEAGLPLLIWLGDDGLRAKDGLDLWRERLGDEAWIIALEPPYRMQTADLSEGGRWYWPDSFSADVGAMHAVVERVWGYALRHLAIDPERVCLAGEGTGATIVAATSLRTGRVAHRAVALRPRHFSKIEDFPLPLPALRGPWPKKSLELLVGETAEDWWRGELEAYEAIGFESRMRRETSDPWMRELETENALRAALGLEARRFARETRGHVVTAGYSPRARHWSRLAALRHASEDGHAVAVLEAGTATSGSTPVGQDVVAECLRRERDLPRCPGPFGGTTVVVLFDDVAELTRAAWLRLEEEDPIRARSRFHRLRVATTAGERALPEVLSALRAKNRNNVLVIPAAFHAGADRMKELQRLTEPFADTMTLTFSPGLGGS